MYTLCLVRDCWRLYDGVALQVLLCGLYLIIIDISLREYMSKHVLLSTFIVLSRASENVSTQKLKLRPHVSRASQSVTTHDQLTGPS